MAKNWYVIHTYSGYENKVKANLEKRIEAMNMGDKIFRIVVPMESHVENKGGKRKVVEKKVFPGYVIVEMEMADDSWYLVRNTSGVTGFVGPGSKPVPLMDYEVNSLLKKMGVESPKFRIDVEAGDYVRIAEGPFENFSGNIEEVDNDKGKVKVMVSMFGRETPVEVDYTQVEKIS